MRVTFWSAPGAAALLVEQGGEKICHVTRRTGGDAGADAALAALASGADLLVFPGGWEDGLAFKALCGAKLLALADGADTAEAEAAARKSANVFFARHKMSLDL